MGGTTEAENHTLPGHTNDSWRAWLTTGARRVPVDARRMQGAHRGLKKILGAGGPDTAESPYTWKDFSGAMVRHAVDDAMSSLPAEDTRVIKLAYFGGYSNREIARHVGLTEGAVQRRLRRALGAISDYIQHGRAIGRNALYAVGLFLTGRWLHDSLQHALPAVTVAGAAAVIIASQTGAPFGSGGNASPSVGAPAAAPVVPPVPSPTSPVNAASPTTAGSVVQDVIDGSPVQLPPLPLPKPPPLPVKPKLP